MPTTPTPPDRTAADPTDTEPVYTVGMVGAGGIANAHLPAWLALGVDVVVFSLEGAEDLVERHQVGTAAGVAGRRPTATVVSSLEQLLGAVDAVDVCTPTSTHADIVLQAAAAGRQVMCEKPLARTAASAAEAVAACAAAGVQLYPGHVVRYFPEYATLQAAVATGTIGQVAVQRFSRAGSRPGPAWFADDELSGGLVMDQSIHDLDFARWTGGEVARVFAQEAQSPGGSASVRSAQVVLTHTSGALSYVTGTWARTGTTFRTTFEVAGVDGILRYDSREHPPLVVDGGAASSDGTGLLPAMPFVESPFLTEIREVYRAFRGGPAPRVSAEDGLQAVRLAEAALESIRTGRTVELSHPATTGEAPTTEHAHTTEEAGRR